jgi:hypothetical protein
MKLPILLTLLAVLLSGCALIEKANRDNTERLLSAAGFRIVPANTPERQQSLNAMNAYRVERRLRGDEVYYVYASPKQNLVYVGRQENFSKYQEILIQQEIASENMAAAQMSATAAQQWNDWACWGPEIGLPRPRMGVSQ